MGMFTAANEDQDTKAINKIINSLKPRDGLLHIAYVHLQYKTVSGPLALDERNTFSLDLLLTEMQQKGYELVDVKFSIATGGAFVTRDVQILYK